MVVAVEAIEVTAAELVVAAEVPTIIQTTRRTLTKTKITLILNLTKGVTSTQIFQLMRHGPVRSTGRKAAKLHIVVTPMSANGSTKPFHVPESSASLT